MKAYLIVTGGLFAFISVLHIWRIAVEWNGLGSDLWLVGGGTVLTLVLAVWAWKLLRDLNRRT